jgi:triacylglycerol lipase
MSVSRYRKALVALFACCAGLAAAAATTDTPRAHEEIRKYGMPYPGTRYLTLRAIYEPYIREAGFEKSRATRDLSYGAHELQRLDVLEPRSEASAAMPIVVFVHGGAFVRGDKGGRDGSEIFDNVLNYFTRHGMLGININYRLAPAHPYPAAAEDLRDVLRWIHENAAEFGGDPDRIFLIGHSAGATHVATYALTERLQFNGGKDGVRGAILMSGVYGDADADGPPHVYFGADPVTVAARVPLAHVDGRSIPLFVIDAEYDPLRMQREAIELVAAICDRDGRCPRHQQVAGHNHYSLVYHINTVDDSIAGSMLDFIRQWSRDGGPPRVARQDSGGVQAGADLMEFPGRYCGLRRQGIPDLC